MQKSRNHQVVERHDAVARPPSGVEGRLLLFWLCRLPRLLPPSPYPKRLSNAVFASSEPQVELEEHGADSNERIKDQYRSYQHTEPPDVRS